MNTNAPERSGDEPLLERFVLRYFIHGKRTVQHALMMGAPPPPPEVKKGIRREFALQRILGIIASKLQIDGILPFPCKLIFKVRGLRPLKPPPPRARCAPAGVGV
jgi:hypothetical protein